MTSASRAKFVVAILMVLTTTIFGLGQALSYQSPVPFNNLIHFATISHQAGDIVINDATSWAKLWNATICENYCNNSAPPPAINFSNTTLIAVFADPNPTGELPNPDFINVTGVFQTRQGLQVDVTVVKCMGKCLFLYFGPLVAPGQIWAPGGGEFQFVTIPKTTGPVSFPTQILERKCPDFNRMTGIDCGQQW